MIYRKKKQGVGVGWTKGRGGGGGAPTASGGRQSRGSFDSPGSESQERGSCLQCPFHGGPYAYPMDEEVVSSGLGNYR